jgi:hypothetical protein
MDGYAPFGQVSTYIYHKNMKKKLTVCQHHLGVYYKMTNKQKYNTVSIVQNLIGKH